jgi:hypothetical protein
LQADACYLAVVERKAERQGAVPGWGLLSPTRGARTGAACTRSAAESTATNRPEVPNASPPRATSLASCAARFAFCAGRRARADRDAPAAYATNATLATRSAEADAGADLGRHCYLGEGRGAQRRDLQELRHGLEENFAAKARGLDDGREGWLDNEDSGDGAHRQELCAGLPPGVGRGTRGTSRNQGGQARGGPGEPRGNLGQQGATQETQGEDGPGVTRDTEGGHGERPGTGWNPREPEGKGNPGGEGRGSRGDLDWRKVGVCVGSQLRQAHQLFAKQTTAAATWAPAPRLLL